MPAKSRTNISLDPTLLAEARSANLNVSAITEHALRAALSDLRARNWAQENAAALQARRDHIAAHGTPLGKWQVLGKTE